MSGYAKPWSKEEDTFLANNYRRLTLTELADHIGRTYNAISLRVSRLGLSSKRKWSEDEIIFLEKRYGTTSNAKIAKALNRTREAVSKYARRDLGLGKKKDAEGMMTLYALFHTIYPHRKYCTRLLQKYVNAGLKVREVNLSTVKSDIKYKMVNIDDFWKWAESHKDMIEFASLEENALGYEPKWVKEKRKQEWLENSNKRWAGKV